MVAVAAGPENKEIKGSKPPAGITWLLAFIPPPNPHVSKVTVLEDGSEKTVSKTLSGVARVPVNARVEPLAATGSKIAARSGLQQRRPVEDFTAITRLCPVQTQWTEQSAI
jgi:hypothetical protein